MESDTDGEMSQDQQTTMPLRRRLAPTRKTADNQQQPLDQSCQIGVQKRCGTPPLLQGPNPRTTGQRLCLPENTSAGKFQWKCAPEPSVVLSCQTWPGSCCASTSEKNRCPQGKNCPAQVRSCVGPPTERAEWWSWPSSQGPRGGTREVLVGAHWEFYVQ